LTLATGRESLRPVRHGIYLPNFGIWGEARAVAETAREAEAAGWDGVFLWDHVDRAFPTDVVDPWVALAAAAATTEHVKLGALVTPVARRRPWKLARETVSLDRLSGGRLVFGAGLGSAGGARAEWAAFSEEMDPVVRAAMLDEGLAVLDALWSGRAVSFRGEHYAVETDGFRPRPLQSPRIPVWVAGVWPARRPLRRAARWDGAFPLYAQGGATPGDVDRVRACVDFLRGERQRQGLAWEGFDVVHLSPPTPGDDPARGAEAAAPYSSAGVTWWLERITPDEFGGTWEGPWPEDAMRERVRQGPPRG
jgi:alkanesulfonate monooxygenase SsuD/methylene tetrahydromethanopterin reductase-like flavin-dependent oxidoreductase (luciferase family)